MAPKNIVICIDGTGNQIEQNLSNVLKLYRTLRKSEDQIVFYDQGVGTLKRVWTWGRLRQKVLKLMGLAFAYGIDPNVLAAYEFIVRNYREEKVDGEIQRDRIYVFGFSRGAHTARILAGLIYEIGILKPEQIHLAPAALTAYKQSLRRSKDPAPGAFGPKDDYEGEGMNFRRVVQPITGAVNFLGLFDTVSSVFIPNPKSLWPPLIREHLPHTSNNPAVETMRHAMAIDEKRRMYRIDRWEAGQKFKPNPRSTGDRPDQDAREVWFSGYHSDVGGGYDRLDSGISQYPLIWMLDEAEAKGLKVFGRMKDYITGVRKWSKTTKYEYPEPKVTAALHNSMVWIWPIFEYLPKSVKRLKWPKRRSFLGYYLPLSEPRCILTDDVIHQSAQDRIDQVEDYDPENVRERCP